MGPVRTSKSTRQAESSTSSNAGPSKPKARRNHSHVEKEPKGLPGVQKIKSSLRQTRRLLAKDKLAADVRVETERRLKALEAELAQAQVSKKERDIAVRYHKVKFFERQKVVRKLNQTKKRIASSDTSSRPQLEAVLLELRVDLNYILHYPKAKKYISLFPLEVREATASEQITPTTNPNSEEVRSWIRERMEAGELSSDPELHLDGRGEQVNKSTQDWDRGVVSKRSEKSASHHPVKESAEQDAFFGDDDGDESSE